VFSFGKKINFRGIEGAIFIGKRKEKAAKVVNQKDVALMNQAMNSKHVIFLLFDFWMLCE
jgi:hypothetical protein